MTQRPRRAALRRRVHRTIERVTIDIDKRLHLNTPVAALMELLNDLQDFCRDATDPDQPFIKEAGLSMALLLQPFAPHISEELWQGLGGQGSAARQAWPVPSPRWLAEDEVEIVVQVNGKVRARISVPAGAGRLLAPPSLSESEAVAQARADARVAPHLEGRAIRKIVFLPGRLLNLVVG